MATSPVHEQILSYLEQLSADQQREVLEFARNLAGLRGEAGDAIVQDALGLDFPLEDLAEIQRIIEADCERAS